ncbi:MAG: divalent-cation tolerance protein CutA [Alphaproteobacteria bacterium GM202ARS2]|nr:divalent-cation tolerance protein CutA [Alphaproteobacteria bacterium GM202ARS2]
MSTSPPNMPCIIYGTVPEQEVARVLADSLIDKSLVACVHRMPPITATFRWQGQVETRTEYPLLIKTSTACCDSALELIAHHHPDSCPGMVVVPISGGIPDFLQWIVETTQPNKTDDKA